MTKNFNRVLFDLDGTLILHGKDSQMDEFAILLNIPIEHRENFRSELNDFFTNCEDLLRNKKMSKGLYYDAMRCLIPTIDKLNISPEKMLDTFFNKACIHSKTTENVHEVLEYLTSKGYKLCVFTNGFYEIQSKILKHHKLLEYFDAIYAWDDYYAKPDLRFMKRALAGTNPMENIMIGDSVKTDILMARRAGVYSVLLNCEEENIESKIVPDVTINNLLELKLLL